ncbi:four helix bundle protein [Rubinisphaera margarita]|uniref:four helix bundle protein n=1 Tax=Rubinisphaera margarita TaxID=2909586 RepID=UPI001EE97FDD|nr:four helix bundle protein [Rubinisphaera margarita]MCG6156711.1 four helix bundle protein [Rubinisphaera margarita]
MKKTLEVPMSESGYRDLQVWVKAMALVEDVYRFAALFPDTERFGLTSQIQRAAVSIPSNIAEGYGCGGGDYGRHINIARGSLAELETQLEIADRLNYLTREQAKPIWQTAQEVGRMLTGLSKALKNRR